MRRQRARRAAGWGTSCAEYQKEHQREEQRQQQQPPRGLEQTSTRGEEEPWPKSARTVWRESPLPARVRPSRTSREGEGRAEEVGQKARRRGGSEQGREQAGRGRELVRPSRARAWHQGGAEQHLQRLEEKAQQAMQAQALRPQEVAGDLERQVHFDWSSEQLAHRMEESKQSFWSVS